MKKKITIVYTIFASAVMLFALSFLGYNLHKEYQQGSSRTASIFANTVFDLYQELDGTDETKRNFSKKVSTAIGDFQNYSFYELQKNGSIVYSYPANSSKEQTRSNFTKDFSTMIEIDENNRYLLTCNIYLLRPYSIYYFSKIAFFIILAVTVLTFIMILFSSKKTFKNKKSNDDELDFNFDEDEETQLNKNDLIEDQLKSDLETELEIDIKENVAAVNIEDDIMENYSKHNEESAITETTPLVDPVFLEKKAEENKESSNHDTIENDDFDDIKLEDFDDDIEDIQEASVNEDKVENVAEEIENNNIQKHVQSEPEGLFSPITGLGWESYLLTRLDNELERSVASEMDISLFVIQITNLERNTETMKKICDYIVEQFQFRDLIFEYKDDCIVAIKNSTTLEDALTFADKIHTEIVKMVNNENCKCYIGISTRTVRIISGERFLTEAEEALLHAKEDNDCSIIAFRADVEKYRKYLETKIDA